MSYDNWILWFTIDSVNLYTFLQYICYFVILIIWYNLTNIALQYFIQVFLLYWDTILVLCYSKFLMIEFSHANHLHITVLDSIETFSYDRKRGILRETALKYWMLLLSERIIPNPQCTSLSYQRGLLWYFHAKF